MDAHRTAALFPHHRAGLERCAEELARRPEVVGAFAAGSIAKGIAKADSDIDLLIVVSPEVFEARMERGQTSESIFAWTDYPGGYVDVKYASVPYLETVAARGSEPTRDSFRDLFPIVGEVPGWDGLVARILAYPEAGADERRRRFQAQAHLQIFFLGESERHSDPFLAAEACSKMVLFGGRAFLASRRTLFPCSKRLLERLRSLGPDGVALAEAGLAVVRSPGRSAGTAYMELLARLVGPMDWPEAIDLYTADRETAWLRGAAMLEDL